MNLLYIARNKVNGSVVSFPSYKSMERFAEINKYKFGYFSIPVVKEYLDEELFLNIGEDPSDFTEEGEQ